VAFAFLVIPSAAEIETTIDAQKIPDRGICQDRDCAERDESDQANPHASTPISRSLKPA
jgi:hypothetical protein